MNNNVNTMQLFFVIAATLLLVDWTAAGKHVVNGDEPHYLIIASGIARFHTFDQKQAYEHEFTTREIAKSNPYNPHLPSNEQATPANTHALQGIHGLYSIHNVGLPLLSALPYLLGGVYAVKLAMILISSTFVTQTYRIVREDVEGEWAPALMTAAVTIPAFHLAAASQIYPDLVAGGIALFILGKIIFSNKKKHDAAEDFVVLSLLGALPWLQIKFMALSLILYATWLSTNLHRAEKRVLLKQSFVYFFLLLLLAFYNWYAFSSIFGPYQSGSLEISASSLMTLLGLHFDLNHGLFLQHPAMLISLWGMAVLWRKSRLLFFSVSLSYASIIVPNAMHPNWYGGFSFYGRFFWTGYGVLLIPATIGAIFLINKCRKIFIGLGILLIYNQLRIYTGLMSMEANLYNGSVPKGVSVFYDSDWLYQANKYQILPQFTDVATFGYLPQNWICLGSFLVLAAVAYFHVKKVGDINLKGTH